MIRVKYCLVAEGLSRDTDTNEMSAFNIFDSINALGFPLVLRRLSYLIVWERDNDDPGVINGRFRLNLDQNNLVDVGTVVDFKNRSRVRTILRINGPVIPGPGLLHFLITLDNGIRAEYTIAIEAPPPAVAEADPAAAPAQ